MIHTFKKPATGLPVFVAGLVMALAYFFLNTIHHPLSILSIKELSGGHTILNLLYYYDSAVGYEHLLSYSPVAIAMYQRVLAFDLVLLIPAYVCFFGLGAHYYVPKLLPKWPTIAPLLSTAAIVAGLLNIAEDAIVYTLLDALPEQNYSLMTLCGLITLLKSFLIITCLLSMLSFISSYCLKIFKWL